MAATVMGDQAICPSPVRDETSLPYSEAIVKRWLPRVLSDFSQYHRFSVLTIVSATEHLDPVCGSVFLLVEHPERSCSNTSPTTLTGPICILLRIDPV